MSLEIERLHPEGYPPHPHPYPHRHPFAPPQSCEIQESAEREIEKSRIREEIIMGEVIRRRMLELEVRRELMMERELGLRRGTNGFQYGLPSVMGFDSPVRFSVEDERNLFLHADRRLKGNFEGGLVDDHPFQRGAARVSEVESISEDGKQERIILLAKPDETYRSKRKAVTMPDAGENPSDDILKKRAREEWCCALCQVSATSEFALKEHLGGRRHKAEEAKLKAKGIGKSQMKGTLLKKILKIGGSVNPAAEDKLKVMPKPLPSQMVFQDKNHPTALLTPEQSDHSKKKKRAREEWCCALCQVSATSEFALKEHMGGRRHKAKEAKLKEKGIGKSQMKRTLSKKIFKIGGSVNPAAEDKLKLMPKSLPSQTVFLDKNHTTALLTPEQSDHPKKKMKFYCEMCKVGANNEKVMEGHKNGKKHIFRLQKFNKIVVADKSNQLGEEKIVALDEVDQFNQLGEDEKIVGLDEVDQSNKLGEDEKSLGLDEIDQSNQLGEDEKTVALDDISEEPLNESKPLDSDHVSTDAIEPEGLDSDHVPTDTVEPEECKTVNEEDTKQDVDDPDTKDCEDDAEDTKQDVDDPDTKDCEDDASIVSNDKFVDV